MNTCGIEPPRRWLGLGRPPFQLSLLLSVTVRKMSGTELARFWLGLDRLLYQPSWPPSMTPHWVSGRAPPQRWRRSGQLLPKLCRLSSPHSGDPAHDVRNSAAAALAKIGPAAAEAVPALVTALGDPAHDVRNSAAAALARIAPATKPATAVSVLAAALEASEEKDVRQSILKALREIGPAAQLPSPILSMTAMDLFGGSPPTTWGASGQTPQRLCTLSLLPSMMRMNLFDGTPPTRSRRLGLMPNPPSSPLSIILIKLSAGLLPTRSPEYVRCQNLDFCTISCLKNPRSEGGGPYPSPTCIVPGWTLILIFPHI
jgi:HEAT repeats